MKGVVRHLEYGFPALQFLENEACLTVDEGHGRHLLQQAVCGNVRSLIFGRSRSSFKLQSLYSAIVLTI
jgi:hypothetical protein